MIGCLQTQNSHLEATNLCEIGGNKALKFNNQSAKGKFNSNKISKITNKGSR
jgi:hypothetical protein